jgi:hypothetical protein
VQYFNKNGIRFLSLLLLQVHLQASDNHGAKIVNEISAEVEFSHTVPSESTAYIHIVNNKIPRARITSWLRGSYGTTKECRALDISKPLPTWVRIAFNQAVSQLVIDDFFSILRATHSIFKDINPKKHGKFNDEFVITVPPHYAQCEIEVFFDQVHIAMQKKQLLKNAEPIGEYALPDMVAFEAKNPVKKDVETIKLRVVNHSNVTAGAFITLLHSGNFVQPTIIFPKQTCDGFEAVKNQRIFITTGQGVFLLAPDNAQKPTKYLLRQYVDDGRQNSVVRQQLPFKFLEKITIQIEADGLVTIIDYSKTGYYV